MLKDLLRIADLSPADLEHLLVSAASLKHHPRKFHNLLEGDLVAVLFSKPSTRTRFSFDAAVHRLGGSTVSVGPAELQLGRGESIEDTAKTISCYVRAMVVRTFADRDVKAFAAAATVPVVNALTDLHHPCQALADLMTLRERFGRRRVRIAYIGDGNNVCHSLIEASAVAGLDLTVATPAGFEPDPGIVAWAHAETVSTRGHLELTIDPGAAVAGADAVYTDTWFSMGTPEEDRARRQAAFAPYQVTSRLMEGAAHDSIFLHCLPAHRGVEVESEVIDGPRSSVWQQAENRLYTEHAVLVALLRGELKGR